MHKNIRLCPLHGEQHFFAEKSKDGIRFRCSKCRTDAVRRKRHSLKLKAIMYKGGKCLKCGYDKCPGALDFHHRDSSEKEFAIGHKGRIRSWDKMKPELDKCDLLCANCHREEHFKEFETIPTTEMRCQLCDKPFTRTITNINKIYCSRKCSFKAQRVKRSVSRKLK